MIRRGADVVKFAEGNIACIAVAGCRWSAGVEERGMQAEGRPGTWETLPEPPAPLLLQITNNPSEPPLPPLE